MTITPEQHAIHLRQLAYFERKADELRKLTRQYQNDYDAQRIIDRRNDSEQFYKRLNQYNATQHMDEN